MESILITGGGGYIGSALALTLKKKIIVVDKSLIRKKILLKKRVIFYRANILNKEKIHEIIKNHQVKTIFHFAAKLNVNESQNKEKEYYANNYLATKNLVDICLNNRIKKFIFSSTSAVYGNLGSKLKENNKKVPISVYGKTKLKAEKYIINKFKKSNVNYAILRYFNVAGADVNQRIGEIGKSDHIIKNFAKISCNKNKVYKIYGNNYNTKDNTAIRDYVHIKDITRINKKIFKLLDIKKKIVINCGFGKGYSVYDIFLRFNKISKKFFMYYNSRSGDPMCVISNNKKLRKTLKYKKMLSINSIINSAILWEKFLLKKNY